MSDLAKRFVALSPEKRKVLLRQLQQNRVNENTKQKIPPRRQEGSTFPLSFAQERLWFLDQLEPQNAVYTFPASLRLTGPFSLRILEECLSTLVQRHETLRTSFTQQQHVPVQIIHQAYLVHAPLIDLENIEHGRQEALMKVLMQQSLHHPFSLETNSLWRVRVLRRASHNHILIFTIHHIITDGWSNEVFIRELATLYHASLAGLPFPLAPLPIQYADFALWQRQWLQGEVLETQLAYWRTQLDGVTPLTLPGDHPHPMRQSQQGASQSWHLSPAISQRVQRLSRQENVTLFMLLLASFQVLLMRYSDHDDISVGTPIANRQQAELEEMIGFFVNTLVLRSDLSGNPSFVELLQRVRAVCLGAYAHQDLPFEKVVEALEPVRDLSRSPLFQVMFVLQNVSQTSEYGNNIQVSPLEMESTVSKFDLTLTVIESQQELHGTLEYNTSLFESITIQRLLSHWQTILQEVLRDPHISIGELSLLTEQEREQTLGLRNATQRDYPRELGVHQLFEQRAQRTPDAVALIFEEHQLSYEELNRHTDQLASYLQQQEVGPEVLVGIYMERSLEMVVALLAVLKAGGAYLPLDPAYPTERIAFMLADADIKIVLTHQEAHCPFASTIQTLDLNTQWEQIAAAQPRPLPVHVTPENLAYVIYTSGSTGKPKGTMNTHQGLGNYLQWRQEEYQLSSRDRVLQKTPYSFDVSVWEFFWPLITGASLIMARPEGHRDPTYLRTLIVEQAITTLHFVPSMLHVFLQEPDLDTCLSLRQVMCSGEALSADLQASFFAHFSDQVQLHNLYGPTEAAIDVTSWSCRREDAIVPIGVPIANTQIYLLDKFLQPVPIGIAGELYIGGLNLARGYLRRADLTGERFIPHPFSTEPGQRLYRTGDLARHLPDGSIEYLGRLDQQVKIRGQRIELGEIEATLRAQIGVEECVVLAREDQPGEKRLVAYIVPTREQTPPLTSHELRIFLQSQLAEYMIPRFFVFLDALPMTGNGKLDRRRLPVPDMTVLKQNKAYVAPRTPLEEILTQIWAELLGQTNVDIQDNFFELGGHSLLATQVISRIRQALHIEIPLRMLFESPRVIDLSAQIEVLQQGSDQVRMHPLIAMKRPQDIPLSFIQTQLWFLNQLDVQSTAYTIAVGLHIHGPFRLSAMQQALTHLAIRHEILRTTFHIQPSGPVQIIADPASVQITQVDLQSLTPEQSTSSLPILIKQEAQAPFDLKTGPLWRTVVIRHSESEHVFLLTMHHIISDGWSLSILVREITELYHAFVQEQPSPLPTLPIQYADYTLWQRAWLQGKILQDYLDYWRSKLADVPASLDLPLDRLRTNIYNQQSLSRTIFMPLTDTEQLRHVSQQLDVTLFMTLLATLKTILFRWSGQDDVAIGTVSSGRTHIEIEPLIGCFLNFLVLRAHLEPTMSWEQLVSQVRTTVLAAYTHQDLPFEKIVEDLQPDRTRYHNPFYNVAFLLQNTPPASLQIDELRFDFLPLPPQDALLDLRFVVHERSDGLQITCEYDAELFYPETIDALLHTYQLALQQIIHATNIPLEAFELPDTLVQQAQQARRRAQKQTLAITATFTAEPLEGPLSYWMRELQLPTMITFAAYNQVLQQFLDPQSLLSTNHNGVNLILLRFDDWLRFTETSQHAGISQQMIEQETHEFLQAFQQLRQRSSVPCILCICPSSPQMQADATLVPLYQQMEQLLTQEISQVSGTILISSQEVMSMYPVDQYYDANTDTAGHIPFTPYFFTALGTLIARKIAAFTFQPYKVIVVDCDQTLWQGVCGEDGPQGIIIDPARKNLQEFLVAQHEAGMLICLCSKNNQQDVFDVFDAHPEMPLQREHLAQVRINWQSKAQNLHSLAQTLNLSLESMIFIDDNPLEQADVQTQCPEVLIFPFPQRIEDLPLLLAHFWAFDQVARTTEDQQRTHFYQQEQQRQSFLQSTPSLEDFLEKLNVQVHITRMEEEHLTRAAQLTLRTNQFNVTTIRRNENEIRQFCREEQGEAFVMHVDDRFGEYGLVGLVLCKSEPHTLRVDTLLLSCRVLGRGVEHRIIAYLGELAQERGLDTVTIPYRATAKNQPAADFLAQTGLAFKSVDEQGWQIVFPVQVAAQLRFQPGIVKERQEAYIAETATKATPVISAETGDRLSQRQLSNIATTLNSVEKIYQQFQFYTPKPRTTPHSLNAQKPTSIVEEELLKIWTELLHLDDLGTTDNFFASGGHSLLATQVLSQVRSIFHVEIPLQSIFENPTIVEMALLIEKMQREFLQQADDEHLAQMLIDMGGASDDDLLSLFNHDL